MSLPEARVLTDKAEIRALLERDRVWAAYSLGDLDDGMFEQCDWYAAGDTLAHTFKGLNFIPFFTMGSVEGVRSILRSQFMLPAFCLYQRPEHVPAIEEYFVVDELHPMWRMVVDRFHPAGTTLPFEAQVVPLGMERLDELQA